MPDIVGYKEHRPVKIHYSSQNFTRPKLYDKFPMERCIGLKTQAFENIDYGSEWNANLERYTGGQRTNLIALDVPGLDNQIVLNTRNYEYSLEAVIDTLFETYSDKVIKLAWTEQREVRSQSNRGRNYRDGRRQYVQPLVILHYGLETDLINLIGNHPQFGRSVMLGATTIKVIVGKYEVEISCLVPSGSAPSFEFYIRYQGKILRLIGRDLMAYLKMKLHEAAAVFLKDEHVEQLNQTWVETRYWESFDAEEQEVLKKYVANNAHIIRLLWQELVNFLSEVEPRVICKSGLPPKALAGAAGRIMHAQSDEEEWPKPPQQVMQMGALAYCGPRVFGRRSGEFTNLYLHDQSSQYPFINTLFPNPTKCEFLDIESGPFDVEKWKGQHGIMLISGVSTDKYYPAIREHDTENQRLRYIYGKFEYKYASIQEVVIGVVSGRLINVQVHNGIHCKGSSEGSYLRKHAEKMYKLKQQHKEGEPLYLLGKLMANAPIGKQAESNKDHRRIDGLTRPVEIPSEFYHDYKYWEQAYVNGNDALDDATFKAFKQADDPDSVSTFGKLINYLTEYRHKAGPFYNPFFAAMTTGMGSAMLGLLAYCTNAIAGHTDGLITIGNQSKGIEQFRKLMEESGYPIPANGMGSIICKISKAKGIVAMGGLFELRVRTVDRETGEVTEQVKSATHGLPHIEGKSAYQLIKSYIDTGKAEYQTNQHSSKYIQSLVVSRTPGTILSSFNTLNAKPNPNMGHDEHGDKVWKDYQDIISKRLNQSTTSSESSLRILQEANRYLANSTLNST